MTRSGQQLEAGSPPGLQYRPPPVQLQRGRSNYVFSFDACKAFDNAPQSALHLILRQFSVPPEVIDLLLFLHTCAGCASSLRLG